mgnify:CR=1 FL=1
MARRGGATGRTGAPTSSSSSTSTSSGSSSASTSSSSKSSGQAGARSSRSTSSVSVSSPSGSKTVKTVTEATPTQTTKETTAQPEKAIQVSAELARAISDSQQAYPDAWTEATGTSNIQKQFEQVTGTTIPSVIVDAPPEVTIPELPKVTLIPEIPQVSAEQQVNLSDDIIQILNDIESGVILVPDWFRNNIEWVKNGHITQQEFRTAYNYLVDTQIVHAPQENLTITDNMITQTVDHFTIQNGRAVGQITFRATENFNPYYYNKNITNIIQFKDRNGINILPTVKQNTLRFTETERDETILYDEGMNDNIIAVGSSFVWLSTGTPTPFSKKLEFQIDEGDPVKPISSGFMAAGITGAIAGLVLLGFIADYKGGK